MGITFTAGVASGGSVDVRFRLEFNPYPDVDPAWDSEVVTVSGSDAVEYVVEIPPLGENTYSSLLMFLNTQDESIFIESICVDSDSTDCDAGGSTGGGSGQPSTGESKVADFTAGAFGDAIADAGSETIPSQQVRKIGAVLRTMLISIHWCLRTAEE